MTEKVSDGGTPNAKEPFWKVEERISWLSKGEKAIRARDIAVSDPRSISFDDDHLPWVFDSELRVWLSLLGNWSTKSPAEKRLIQDEIDLRVTDEIVANKVWSYVRLRVLARDKNRCQLCGDAGETRLHVHHILKRREGGTDHMDNLITVCPRCHKAADGKLYSPDWRKSPGR